MRRRRLSLAIGSGAVAAAAVLALAGTAAAGSSSGAVTPAAVTTTSTIPPNLAAANVKLVQWATGLDSPVAMAWKAGDSRAYVAQQTGKVVIVSGGHVVATALDLTALVSTGGERGLLGLTFTRDGTKLYVDYTDLNGSINIVEYTMQGSTAMVASRRPLLTIPHPNTNHNGGEVAIGPDGMLYIGTGDGGGGSPCPPCNGQNTNVLLGKILRIDPRVHGNQPYGIPANNPFATSTTARHEIWMWGLRNPWRWSFDRATFDMWIGDVGENLWEEIDYAAVGTQRGVNWGWSKREGLHPYNGGTQPPGARNPILERSHSDGDCAITGGYVYRAKVITNFTGAYVFGDFCTGELRAVTQHNGVVTQSKDLGVTVSQLSSFGEGPLGGLYAISHAGTIYSLANA